MGRSLNVISLVFIIDMDLYYNVENSDLETNEDCHISAHLLNFHFRHSTSVAAEVWYDVAAVNAI